MIVIPAKYNLSNYLDQGLTRYLYSLSLYPPRPRLQASEKLHTVETYDKKSYEKKSRP